MKDYFDPRIPEDLEVLTALVKLNPNVELEMKHIDGIQTNWNWRGANVFDNGRLVDFSTKLYYRLKGVVNENTDATET